MQKQLITVFVKRNRPKQGAREGVNPRQWATMRRWRDVRMTVNLLFVGRTRRITQYTASGMHSHWFRYAPVHSCVKNYRLCLLGSVFSHSVDFTSTKQLLIVLSSFTQFGEPKNPECESVQNFHFLPLHSSFFTKIHIQDFLKVIGKSE